MNGVPSPARGEMQESVAELLNGTHYTADESGSAPGDRKFRADVEGLRAVAIVLVVLYHGGLTFFSGGYVGVDVFFVISGFVITGVLLRERDSTGRTSFLNFYGRRSRRIIPAATLVILATVIGTYLVLGPLYGNPTAVDARWTSVFLANFHFASTGTDYLNAQEPPSPLLNFWSLAVEEQFYLVFPMFFLLIAALRSRVSLHARLAVGLVLIIVASFALSVVQSNVNPTLAYFSPFTRAWELALGALVCVGTKWLFRLPKVVCGVMTWIGLGAIGFSAVVFNGSTVYPGSFVAVPVIGTGLVIAGGTASPRWAAESLLGLRPFRWMGRLSYSLYLWHWPLLIIAAESYGKASLPFHQNVVWLLAALVAAIGTYRWVENPVRHAQSPFPRMGCHRPWHDVDRSVADRRNAGARHSSGRGIFYLHREDRHERHRPSFVCAVGPSSQRRAGRSNTSGEPRAAAGNGSLRLGWPGSTMFPRRRAKRRSAHLRCRGPTGNAHHGRLWRFSRCHVVRRFERRRASRTLEAHRPGKRLLPGEFVAVCEPIGLGYTGR